MKTIKNITKEQAIEIAKMIWGFDDSIKSDLTFKYFDGNYGAYTNEEDEDITVTFDAEVSPQKRTAKMFVHIYRNLDCSIGEFEFSGCWRHKRSYPVRNQNAVQKKFIEWGIEPTEFGANKHIVKN